MDIPLTDLFAKARVYIKDPNDAPSGANVQRGPQGGYYYDDSGKGSGKEEEQEQGAAPEEKEQQLMEPEEWESVDAVQQQATNILENNQGIPEEGSADRQALNQMVARMSELTGQDPHEIASELTQQMEEALGGEFRPEAVDELGAGSDWSSDSEIQDPRSPSYEVTTNSLQNSIDEILHGRYSQLYLHPERKATERKWLERLESNLSEAGYMDTEISRAAIDRMFEEFVDEQPDGWLWDDRNRREELAEYTDAILGDAREEDYKELEYEEGGTPEEYMESFKEKYPLPERDAQFDEMGVEEQFDAILDELVADGNIEDLGDGRYRILDDRAASNLPDAEVGDIIGEEGWTPEEEREPEPGEDEMADWVKPTYESRGDDWGVDGSEFRGYGIEEERPNWEQVLGKEKYDAWNKEMFETAQRHRDGYLSMESPLTGERKSGPVMDVMHWWYNEKVKQQEQPEEEIDDDMQRRMDETGMSADAIRELDAEYERDDIADVADDYEEQQLEGSPTLPSGYDPYEEYDPYNEQEEEVEHENLIIENYHDGIEAEQDMTVENQMKLQAGEMSLEEAGFGPEYDEQSALDFYDDYHVALEKYAGMHPNALGKQTPATVAEQKALELAFRASHDAEYIANAEFGYDNEGKEGGNPLHMPEKETYDTGYEEDEDMQRRMDETGMSADAIRELDAEYEEEDDYEEGYGIEDDDDAEPPLNIDNVEDGMRVKLHPDWSDSPDEIFTIDQIMDNKVWIGDKSGRGWYVYPSQLLPVGDDEEEHEWR